MVEQSGRYQQLPSEEEAEEGPQVSPDAPPPYSSIAADSAAYFDCKEDTAFPKPPSYNVATSLPSYDEAERSKAETFVPLVTGRDDDFVARDDFEDADQLRIGNDGIFMLTFFMAFLFNWIGFFLSFCLTTSAAGRYGAISGFGLSLIKWILIVRFSTYFPGYFDGQYWLWWVFLVLGMRVHVTECRFLFVCAEANPERPDFAIGAARAVWFRAIILSWQNDEFDLIPQQGSEWPCSQEQDQSGPPSRRNFVQKSFLNYGEVHKCSSLDSLSCQMNGGRILAGWLP
ncbi:NEDD4 family-interacting protein 1 isoform X2, partial [Clarias magur]